MFDSFYCIPGIEGAHEKGGIEGEIGRFRRNHLVPVPNFATLGELNELIDRCDGIDDSRFVDGRPMCVGDAFALELPHLRALPLDEFDCAKILAFRVDYKARICVRQCFYSVPAHLAGRSVIVRLFAQHFEVLFGGKVVAVHERLLRKKENALVLDHYLEVLTKKPGALAGSIALDQARRKGLFTKSHDRFWTEARRQLGDRCGTNALIGVLLLHRTLGHGVIVAGINAALLVGCVDLAVVELEARLASSAGALGDVNARSVGSLARYDRPVPSLGIYDTLIGAN
jgi:hypothetical protein